MKHPKLVGFNYLIFIGKAAHPTPKILHHGMSERAPLQREKIALDMMFFLPAFREADKIAFAVSYSANAGRKIGLLDGPIDAIIGKNQGLRPPQIGKNAQRRCPSGKIPSVIR